MFAKSLKNDFVHKLWVFFIKNRISILRIRLIENSKKKTFM